MEVHEVIEEVDEDKNNNNTNSMKSGKYNNGDKNNNKDDNNSNIKVKKEDNYEERELKEGFNYVNKFIQMHKRIALSKEKYKNKINIISNDEDIINGIKDNNKSNNILITPGAKNSSKIDNISKINLPLLNNPTNISSKNKKAYNLINETPSTSAYTNSTKNNLRNDHNLTEQVSKFRIGLFSANSSSNYNAIIPILPIKRPVSNFNFGGNQLWEKDELNKDIKKKESNETIEEKGTNSNKDPKMKTISLNKVFWNNRTKSIFKSTECRNKSISSSNKSESLNNINLKTKTNKFEKEKEHNYSFSRKLFEFKKKSNHFNKNSNYFLSRNGNKSHSLKKFI